MTPPGREMCCIRPIVVFDAAAILFWRQSRSWQNAEQCNFSASFPKVQNKFYAQLTSDTLVQTMMTATRYAQVAILDDDASVRKALVRLFETSRYQAKAYASVGDFLATLDQNMPECIVADLQMPNMTGLELLSYLGRGRIDIPTIIITAFTCRQPDTMHQRWCLGLFA